MLNSLRNLFVLDRIVRRLLTEWVLTTKVSQEALQLVKQITSPTASPKDSIKEMQYVAKDARGVLHHAGLCFTNHSWEYYDIVSAAPGHGFYHGRPLVSREQLRILHSWYFLKSYAMLFKSSPEDKELRLTLNAKLVSMNDVKFYVHWQTVTLLCEDIYAVVGEVSIPVSVEINGTSHLFPQHRLSHLDLRT